MPHMYVSKLPFENSDGKGGIKRGKHKLVMKLEISLQEGRTLMKKTEDIVEQTRFVAFEKKKNKLSP
jgi:hypothetical protein